jgi:parvulin-like peptidyl-prolyl isomerase
MMKRGILVTILVLFSFGLAWSAPPIDLSKEADPQKVILTVNGVSFYEPDLYGEMSFLLPKMKLHRTISDRRFRQILQKALYNMIERELVHQDARAQGLEVSKKEVNEEIERIEKEIKKPIEEILDENVWTIDQFKTQIVKEKLVEKHFEEKGDEVKGESEKNVTEEFMTDYYENNKEKFMLPGSVRLREILIKADSGGGPDHWEEVRGRAMDILDRINGGEDFAEMAKEYSQDVYAEKGGDLGLGHVGSFTREIDAAVKGLDVGEVAGPVWSLYGYHILKVEERVPAVQLTYDEVKKRLKGELEEKERKRLWKKWLADLREKATIEYSEELKEVAGE